MEKEKLIFVLNNKNFENYIFFKYKKNNLYLYENKLLI